MAPFAVYESYREGFSQIRTLDLELVFYLAIGPSFVAYVLIGYALTHLEASQAAVYGNVMPFAGALAGYVFLNEQIGIWHFVGGAFIVLGVVLATRSIGPTAPVTNRRVHLGSAE
jgi:drug/metabolite transporter (DMT)-like permease